MSKRIKPQDFASAGNYSAGSDDWSGQPRKVTMTTSEKAQGFTPNTPVTAERRNGLHAEHFDAQTVQCVNAMRSWKCQELPDIVATGYDMVADFLIAAPLEAGRQKAVVCVLHDGDDSNQVKFIRSYGAGDFANIRDFNVAGGASFQCAAGGAANQFMTGTNTGVVNYTDLGDSRSAEILSGTPPAMHYIAAAGIYLAAYATSGRFDRGSSLASMGLQAAFGVTSFATGSLGTSGGEFASDGLGNVVYVASSVVGGVTRVRIFRSGDNGITWSIAHTFANTVTGANVVYHEAAGQFVAWDSDGFFYTSSNGAGFVAVSGNTGVTAAAGASIRYNTMASQGNCIAKVFSPANGATNYPRVGIAYTFDVGLTWRHWIVSDQDSFGFEAGINHDLRALLGANGRFYATDGTRVFTSGIVEAEDADDAL